MKLYTYAVIYLPDGKDDETYDYGNCAIIVEPAYMLAESEETVRMKAIRLIPSEYDEKLEDMDVLVRPF